ncbi:SDR family NAD(P)-dependent oxidoreductase [Kribbella qitaiheensis]|uniref:SDR family NAD(P)-dependent oxidoreductase n=1 Tax=Kribbella qitaiheensis TaxID=1544730 RepID=A0A7G6WTY8_9ACTN|nr:SDR family NAD(P)-dependent oxidoreductase [Kribbella qitaiheensis]QNE17453.1 SDR family NAD(P)-dependent oxidoreductase [Kribbella qitaiheensis]
MEIKGKLAVVTGAAVGIGRGIAQRLAAEGASVVLADIDVAGAEETRELIGDAARFVRTDMRDDDAVAELMSYEPQILVNNAGGGPELRPCFPDADVGRWTASLDLNLRAPMLTTQLALEPMRRAGGGVVINLGSTAGLGFGPHVSPEYSAAKAALIRLTATLGVLRESHQVRVNCVVPDWVATERGLAEQAELSDPGPPLIPLETLTDAVVNFIEDDSLAGRVILLDREQSPRLLG